MNYTPYLRVSAISEITENKTVFLDVTGEIIPRYALGLPDVKEDLEKSLTKVYEDYKDKMPNRLGRIVKGLAIETMLYNEKPKRAEKLEKLKLVLKDSSTSYDDRHFLFQFNYRFKPLLVPVFEKNFDFQGVLYSDPLDESKIDNTPSVASVLPILKKGLSNARHNIFREGTKYRS